MNLYRLFGTYLIGKSETNAFYIYTTHFKNEIRHVPLSCGNYRLAMGALVDEYDKKDKKTFQTYELPALYERADMSTVVHVIKEVPKKNVLNFNDDTVEDKKVESTFGGEADSEFYIVNTDTRKVINRYSDVNKAIADAELLKVEQCGSTFCLYRCIATAYFPKGI